MSLAIAALAVISSGSSTARADAPAPAHTAVERGKRTQQQSSALRRSRYNLQLSFLGASIDTERDVFPHGYAVRLAAGRDWAVGRFLIGPVVALTNSVFGSGASKDSSHLRVEAGVSLTYRLGRYVSVSVTPKAGAQLMSGYLHDDHFGVAVEGALRMSLSPRVSLGMSADTGMLWWTDPAYGREKTSTFGTKGIDIVIHW